MEYLFRKPTPLCVCKTRAWFRAYRVPSYSFPLGMVVPGTSQAYVFSRNEVSWRTAWTLVFSLSLLPGLLSLSWSYMYIWNQVVKHQTSCLVNTNCYRAHILSDISKWFAENSKIRCTCQDKVPLKCDSPWLSRTWQGDEWYLSGELQSLKQIV